MDTNASIIGGLVGLIFIVLANLLPALISLANYFAIVNLSLFVCLLFSPYFLVYILPKRFEGSRLPNIVILLFYIVLAPLIGLMVAYLDCGNTPFSPSGISILLLIPGINIISSIFIGSWLGLLLYTKVFQGSYLFMTIIGSPLFSIPLFITLADKILSVLPLKREEAYVFDKVHGSLIRRNISRGRLPLKRLLLTVIAFMLLGLTMSTGFGVWNEVEERNVKEVREAYLLIYSGEQFKFEYLLKVSFCLVNVRNKTTAVDGSVEISIFSENGSCLYSIRSAFSEKQFSHQKIIGKWICILEFPCNEFLSSLVSKVRSVTMLPSILKLIGSSYAVLKVQVRGERNLHTTAFMWHSLSLNDLLRLYFLDNIRECQNYIDREWGFRAYVRDYFKLGDRGWLLIETDPNSVPVCLNPLKMAYVYKWYLYESGDGGANFNISWGGDYYPTFKIEIIHEGQVRVKTPYAIYITYDGGETWLVVQ